MKSTLSIAQTLRLASVGATPHCSPGATRALQSCREIEALARLAAEQRMAGWLAAVIASRPETAGNSALEPIREAGLKEAVRTMRLFGELTRFLAILNKCGIPVVVLKGPAIADSHYPEPTLRTYGDIDLLIHERDLSQVSGLLVERGYGDKNDADGPHRLHQCHGIFQRIFRHPETGNVIEVHCDHLQIGLEPVSMETIWQAAEDRRFGRAAARVLEDHDLFVQLCVHLNRHGFERLAWFKDIDLMIRRNNLDWQVVARKATAQGCLDSVSYTLRLLARTLACPLPIGARAIVRNQTTWSRLLFQVVWPPRNVTRLTPQRQWRLRRLVQFAPETGLLRGGLPSFLMTGRRKDKLRVLAAAARREARALVTG